MFDSAGLILLEVANGDASSSFRFRLSPDSACFDGHFDGLPVLPGVAHLAMVSIAHARRSGRELGIAAARDLRFRQALGPGDEVELVLSTVADSDAVRFAISRSGALASSGTVTFAQDDDSGR